MKPLIIFTSYPNRSSAQKIAKILVKNRLAACVQILGPIESHYWWKTRQEKSKEYLVLIKSTKKKYLEIEKTITDLHPYEIPEIIAVPVSLGFSKYLNWMSDSIS
ncbi:MAG: divalent-cation tolerance protein CutA [candidate division WOR-3 bacterium]|nr:divalent-cation tolerance protein CutA [candidate division WOR-3 bacterium]MCX7757763.1 divalent-cation tolerance protein CutA [candidate division WOR-3 bacterium]MDW7988299.1 divalent-cation tolerance protein CutA [candidate division WOR-3 bacterium]